MIIWIPSIIPHPLPTDLEHCYTNVRQDAHHLNTTFVLNGMDRMVVRHNDLTVILVFAQLSFYH